MNVHKRIEPRIAKTEPTSKSRGFLYSRPFAIATGNNVAVRYLPVPLRILRVPVANEQKLVRREGKLQQNAQFGAASKRNGRLV